MNKYVAGIALLFAQFYVTNPTIAAEEPALTIKVSVARLSSLPDKSVDDLCRSAEVIWNYVPTKENADAMSTVCAVAWTRRKAAGKTPEIPEPFPLQK